MGLTSATYSPMTSQCALSSAGLLPVLTVQSDECLIHVVSKFLRCAPPNYTPYVCGLRADTYKSSLGLFDVFVLLLIEQSLSILVVDILLNTKIRDQSNKILDSVCSIQLFALAGSINQFNQFSIASASCHGFDPARRQVR